MMNRRETYTWDLEKLQQFIIPLDGLQIKQLGAGRVADIRGMHNAAGQFPKQPTINIPNAHFVFTDSFALSRFQQPTGFAGGKQRIDRQSGALSQKRFETTIT